MLFQKEGYHFRRDGAKLWMLYKLSQTFLQNLIIHPADRRGYTKSNSTGMFKNSLSALSELARTKQEIKSDVLNLSSSYCFYYFYVWLMESILPCVLSNVGLGYACLNRCWGCVDGQLVLSENTLCGLATHKSWGEDLFLWWLVKTKCLSRNLIEAKVFSSF